MTVSIWLAFYGRALYLLIAPGFRPRGESRKRAWIKSVARCYALKFPGGIIDAPLCEPVMAEQISQQREAPGLALKVALKHNL